MTRELKRDIYQMFTEVHESKQGAMAMPCGEERVQSSKGETGHGAWYEASIDFFHVAGDDRPILDNIYLRSVVDTRKRLDGHEKKVCREFWKEVKSRKLHLVGKSILAKQDT